MPDKKNRKIIARHGVQLTTQYAENIVQAIMRFAKDRGLSDHDTVRLLVSDGLIRAGYLPQTPSS